MADPKMPGLFESADRAAVAAQAKFVRVQVADLILLVLVAVLGALSPVDVKFKEGGEAVDVAAVGTIALLVVGLVLALAFRTAQFNKRWFAARAIAESVKTEVWRFVMRAPPHSVDGVDGERVFKEKLKQINDAQPEAHLEMAKQVSTDPWVSTEMTQIRALNVGERFARYLADRIDNQKKWYAAKAQQNRDAEGRWFTLGLGTHGLAVVLVLLSLLKVLSLNWVGMLTTVAASFVAWTQLRDHQRLANSYAMIAQELSMLVPSTAPDSEDELAKVVEEVERTISREHTMWISRKL